MAERINISTGTPWEKRVGYSRVVRVGDQIFVAGTLAADESGSIACIGDAHGQMIYVLHKIERALQEAGAELRHVVRLTIYITNIDDQVEVGRAHKEVMGDICPATTLIAVPALAAKDALVEVEAMAMWF